MNIDDKMQEAMKNAENARIMAEDFIEPMNSSKTLEFRGMLLKLIDFQLGEELTKKDVDVLVCALACEIAGAYSRYHTDDNNDTAKRLSIFYLINGIMDQVKYINKMKAQETIH